ncbi:MAG: carotenoid 1,2-hydratase [Gammaproteobacteria bacterium]|nr:carotenoid 1,2-hydratase [Gammaproteobacteria bacterium]
MVVFHRQRRDEVGAALRFQLTFFRFAHGARDEYRDSAWRHEHSYMAHFAVSDVAGKRLLAAQDYARGALDLAGALADPFRVWVNGWSARTPARHGEAFAARLSASGDAAAIDIDISTDSAPLLQGEDGYSVKDAAGATASYYYSFPDLAARGTLTVGGESFEVEGRAWMDREWSTRVLSRDLDGWDWFALRTSDGSAIMVFRCAGRAATATRWSWTGRVGRCDTPAARSASSPVAGGPAATAAPATRSGGACRSPEPASTSRSTRPSTTGELDLDFRYYEGVVDAAGAVDNRPVSGEGYMELTGY